MVPSCRFFLGVHCLLIIPAETQWRGDEAFRVMKCCHRAVAPRSDGFRCRKTRKSIAATPGFSRRRVEGGGNLGVGAPGNPALEQAGHLDGLGGRKRLGDQMSLAGKTGWLHGECLGKTNVILGAQAPRVKPLRGGRDQEGTQACQMECSSPRALRALREMNYPRQAAGETAAAGCRSPRVGRTVTPS